MNYRFLFLICSLFCINKSLSATGFLDHNNYSLKVNIFHANTRPNGNGMVVLHNVEEGKKIINNEAAIVARLKEYFPDRELNIKFRFPIAFGHAGDVDQEQSPTLIPLSTIPSFISEKHLLEVLKDYCTPQSIIFFRHPSNHEWINHLESIETLLSTNDTFIVPNHEVDRSHPIEQLKNAINFVGVGGFDTQDLTESMSDPDKFSREWESFKIRNNLEGLKKQWIEEQEDFIYGLLNTLSVANRIIEEPKLLASGLVWSTVECESLEDAFNLHQRIMQSGWESEAQPITSEVDILISAPGLVVLDKNLKNSFYSRSPQSYQIITAPVSEDNFNRVRQTINEILKSQQTMRLNCTLGNTIESHEVVLVGSPTLQDLREVLEKHFPDYRISFPNLHNDANLAELSTMELDVSMEQATWAFKSE